MHVHSYVSQLWQYLNLLANFMKSSACDINRCVSTDIVCDISNNLQKVQKYIPAEYKIWRKKKLNTCACTFMLKRKLPITNYRINK